MTTVLCNKLTLTSGKTILLKEITIEHQEMAAQAVGNETNQLMAGVKLQKEILKQIILAIDDKTLSKNEIEGITKLITPKEYSQILKYIKSEVDDEASPKLEIVNSSGGN